MCSARPRACERGVVGGPAGLLAQAGDGEPEHPGGAHRVEVELGRLDVEVGSLGLAVEVEREVVGREDLAERDRGLQSGIGRDVAVVHSEPVEFPEQVAAERVVADPRDQRGAVTVARGGDRDVGGAAAEVLAERLHVLEPDARLEGVDVHARGDRSPGPRGCVMSRSYSAVQLSRARWAGLVCCGIRMDSASTVYVLTIAQGRSARAIARHAGPTDKVVDE